MNDLIKAYDLGSFQTVESSRKISVNELVRKAQKVLKKRLVEAQVEALGIKIDLTTTKTRFNGDRIWFLCPVCEKRAGTILCRGTLIGCRKCLRIVYSKQRYRGMIEAVN